MIISIATQKGGTGKSTTSLSLSAGLARIYNKRVLLVDMDPQANSSAVLIEDYPSFAKDNERGTVWRTILEKEPLPIYETRVPNLSLVPSHLLLSNADIRLTTALDHREARLKNQLKKVADQYDFIFLDCPPALNWLTINAFSAAEYVLVVFSPGFFELSSINQILGILEEVRENFNPQIELLGFLLNMSDSTNACKVSLEMMRSAYGDLVFRTAIPRNTALREAHFNHTDIFDYRPNATSSKAYKRFIEEVFLNGK
ncbi:MAG: ParA family protein [Candidatus Promineifilaceae bacterium]